ncbi:MAG: DUF5063 domain-containing protein [Salinivirgaceae bacterium]|nr:DUF5063 domain-containing protein [Salinivirgaceae bacterium]
MTDDFEKIVYSDEVIAFTALAGQYCNMIDHVAAYSQKDFINQQHRLLSLLYVKTLSLPNVEPIDPEMVEKTVTQEEWDEVHNAVALKLAGFDSYSEVYDPLAGDDAMSSLSEGFADIFQDLKDYLSLMQMGSPEMMNDAIWECARNFREYWGQRLVNIVRVLHHLIYSEAALKTDDAMMFEKDDDRPSWERSSGQSELDNE